MLVLSRKADQAVVIGNAVTVTVIEITRDRVKLGFTAADSIPIYREELHRRLEAELPLAPQSTDSTDSPFFAECA